MTAILAASLGSCAAWIVGGVAGCVKNVKAFWFSLSLLFESG